MVKKLDEIRPCQIDHLGWFLWRAARSWKVEFDAQLAANGLGWFTEAHAALLLQIGDSGARQAELARRMRMTKQALQQRIDELVVLGVVERRPDRDDARGKVVVLTLEGLAASHTANEIKQRIEARHAERLGQARFDLLMTLLDALVKDENPT